MNQKTLNVILYLPILISIIIVIYYIFFSATDTQTKAIIATAGATIIYATLTFILLREQRKSVKREFLIKFIEKFMMTLYNIVRKTKRSSDENNLQELHTKVLFKDQPILFDYFRKNHKIVLKKINKYDHSAKEKGEMYDLLKQILRDIKEEMKKYQEEYDIPVEIEKRR